MTLPVQNPRVIYTGNGSQTSFAIPQEFFSDEDNVLVVLRDETDPDDITESTLIDPTHYGITGTNVIMVTAPTASQKLGIFIKLDLEQETDFIPSGAFSVTALEDQLDKLTAMVQQVQGDADRSLKFQKTSPSAFFLEISGEPLADTVPIVNADGDAIEWLDRADLTGGVGPQGPQGDPGPTGPQGDPGEGVAAGGTAGQLLSKIDGTDYNTEWVDAPTSLPPGGTIGQVLTKQSVTDGDADWQDPTGGGGGTPFQESLTGTFAAGDTTYTLSNTPTDDMDVIGFLGPLFQVQGVHYTISGVTITFAGEDTSADNFNCFYRY